MSKAIYTPGPWQYYYDQSDHYVHKVRAGAGLVCQMPGWWVNSELKAEQEANARLISAAPEMFVLIDLVHKSFSGGRVITFSDEDIERFEALVTKVKGDAA